MHALAVLGCWGLYADMVSSFLVPTDQAPASKAPAPGQPVKSWSAVLKANSSPEQHPEAAPEKEQPKEQPKEKEGKKEGKQADKKEGKKEKQPAQDAPAPSISEEAKAAASSVAPSEPADNATPDDGESAEKPRKEASVDARRGGLLSIRVCPAAFTCNSVARASN